MTAVQPKAAGSSLMAQLTNHMLLDIMRKCGESDKIARWLGARLAAKSYNTLPENPLPYIPIPQVFPLCVNVC